MSHFKSRWWQFTSLLVVFALVMGATLTARAAIDGTIFELDGNPQDASGTAGDDWSRLYGGTGSADLVAFSGVVPDPLNTTIFTGGGSKDDLDVTSWRWTNGAVPDKDEITNAYAAAYKKNGDLILYFGADRYATNGNAALGFWFTQDDVAPVSGGTFSGQHRNGDVLVLSEFTNGGSQPTIQVYAWEAGGPINGTLRLLTNVSSACNTPQGLAAHACAIVNTGTVASPWPYQPKSGASGSFAKGAFFEGAVNLTQLFSAGVTPCISSFIAETRSSQSVDATLKDFDAGNFDLCGASIQIGASGVNAVGDNHTFNVTINQQFGNVSQPAANGTKATVTLTPSDGVTVVSDSCATTGTVNGTCAVIFKRTTAGVVTGNASANVQVGDTAITVSTNGVAPNSGPATKRYVDASVSITPLVDVNEVNDQHIFNITATGIPSGATVDSISITPRVSPDPTSQSTTCNAPIRSGNTATCTLTINSSSATTYTANATAVVNFSMAGGSPSTASVTRSTDSAVAPSGPGGSGPAIKHYVDAAIKVTPNGVNEVGDAHIFTVEVTAYPSGASPVSFAITPIVSPNPTTKSDTCANAIISGNVATCTLTINSSSAGTFEADASATVTMGGLAVTRSTTGNSGPSGNTGATKEYVDASIAISPLTDTNGIGEQHVFNITVTAHPSGASPVSFGTITPSVSPNPTSKSDTCATPLINGNVATCTLTINSDVAATYTANASASVTMGGVTVERATNGNSGPAGSGSATKIYVAGTLRWLKVDQDNAPLGGATFEVCGTHNFVSADGSFADVADDCVIVLDNGANDDDKDDGEFQRNGQILGRYTIRETAAPAGYAKDETIVTVELTIANPSNVSSAPTFVNTKLFKLIVITCNQSTNELVKSTVTLDTNGSAPGGEVTLDTLDSSTIAGLCDLEGANFGNLRQGTYAPSVVLPKPQP